MKPAFGKALPPGSASAPADEPARAPLAGRAPGPGPATSPPPPPPPARRPSTGARPSKPSPAPTHGGSRLLSPESSRPPLPTSRGEPTPSPPPTSQGPRAVRAAVLPPARRAHELGGRGPGRGRRGAAPRRGPALRGRHSPASPWRRRCRCGPAESRALRPTSDSERARRRRPARFCACARPPDGRRLAPGPARQPRARGPRDGWAGLTAPGSGLGPGAVGGRWDRLTGSVAAASRGRRGLPPATWLPETQGGAERLSPGLARGRGGRGAAPP